MSGKVSLILLLAVLDLGSAAVSGFGHGWQLPLCIYAGGCTGWIIAKVIQS